MREHRVRVAKLARLDIKRRNRWWKRKRPAAPKMFRNALHQAFELIGENVGLGTVWEYAEISNTVWRIQTATTHWVYYTLADSPPPRHVLVLGIEGPGQEDAPDIDAAYEAETQLA